MKVRVMVYHPDRPYWPIALSNNVYELADEDVDDELARFEIIAEWKRTGSRATGNVSRSKEPGLKARCVPCGDRALGGSRYP